MSLPTSNWMKLNELRFQKLINALKIYEVKQPDTDGISLKDLIYLLEGSREEIYKLITKVEYRDDKIKYLENTIENK